MKLKATVVATLCLLAMPFIGVRAQDGVVVIEENKPLHPQKGDIGVVIGADPVMNFLGNLFNGTTNNQFDWSAQMYTIGARYYLTNSMAVRASCQFNNGNPAFKSELFTVQDDAALAVDPLSTKRINDREAFYENAYTMSGGIMFFRGKNKLRGFYGGDVMYGFARTSRSITYGNQMTAANPTPSTSAPNAGAGSPATRLVEELPSFMHTMGITGFGGIEYFFCPQISLGFEAGIMLSASFQGQKTLVLEKIDNGKRVQYNQTEDDGAHTVSFNTMNPLRGSLFLTFHF